MRRQLCHGLLRAAVACLLVVAMAGAAAAKPVVAVVLGGGAARGFSHIGLLKAFEEEGIPIDMLVGTSMGSIVAGLYAAGFSPGELEYMVQEISLSELFAPLFPPRGGLLDTAGFERFLEQLTEGARIEELEMPFYSVITNLVTGEPVALDRGPLSRAIVASMSIPGMFPPVEIDGAMYVDGGIKEPVPVLHARRHGADVVIAVDVRRELDEIDHDAIITNLQLTLYFLLDENTEEQLQYADVVISPKVETASYMEYGRAVDFIEEGYRAAKEAIPEIKALLTEKDPSIAFVPKGQGDGPGEEFRRRLRSAVEVASPEGVRSGPRVSMAVAFEAQRSPKLDVGLTLPLAGKNAKLVGLYEHGRRFGKAPWHTLGAGVQGKSASAAVFVRRAGDGEFYPGARVKATLGGEGPGRIRLLGEWAKLPEKSVTRLDAAVEWSFPLRERGLWELAMVEPATYVGIGASIGGDAGEPGDLVQPRYRVEAGMDVDLRLFGIYPVNARLALQYRGGESPWMLRLSLGE